MTEPTIGVIIVTYRSAEVILECLDSILRSTYPHFRIIVCDNNSPDNTVESIRAWAASISLDFAEHSADLAGALSVSDFAKVTLLRSSENRGFAGGVNVGLRALQAQKDVELFWLLNPDSVATAGAAAAYVGAAMSAGKFALMGGRISYLEAPNKIQSDGGTVSRWTGVCSNINSGQLPPDVDLPDSGCIDFISGANLVASRAFLDEVGLMREDYFLYYEEVDWSFRRGDLPLVMCPEALVYHHGGTAIGSGSISRRASPFAEYFNFRNRMRFVYRFNRRALPVAYVYSLLKIGKLVLLGAGKEALAAACGLHQLSPPSFVAAQVSPDASKFAFGPQFRATGLEHDRP